MGHFFWGPPRMPNIRLRQDTVKSLTYLGTGKQEQCIYWDSALECFGLRIYPTGRRVYVCSYRIQKRKRLACLGRADVLTLDQARKKARMYLGKVASDEDPQAEADRLRMLKTMGELCVAYVAYHAKPKKISWKDDESHLRRHVLPRLKTRLAVSITSADIEAIHAEAGAAHPYAANRLAGIVRKMFNWARLAGYVPKNHANPAVGITRFPERKRRRFLTTAEMPRFVEALDQEDNDYARHAIWLLLLTGLRCNELLKARWKDIDWDRGTLFIGLTKNGDPLLSPLTNEALEQLRAIPKIADNPYIICGNKTGMHLVGVREPLKRVLKRAGIENLRVHDLRRTVGSWLAQDGVSLHLIGQVLNHRDTKTTAGYAYFQTGQRREVLATHGQRIFALTPVRPCAAPHREPTDAQKLLATDIYSTNCGVPAVALRSKRAHYFRREVLYELVWTMPITEIAQQFGVSNVAIGKLCRRAAIPTPWRGYWPCTSAGQRLERTPLPEAPAGLSDLLRVRGTAVGVPPANGVEV
jgi:integrase